MAPLFKVPTDDLELGLNDLTGTCSPAVRRGAASQKSLLLRGKEEKQVATGKREALAAVGG